MLTPAIDSQILRTIAAIQTKDPKVYDSSKKFFKDEDLEKAREEALKKKQEAAEEKTKKKVQFTLKDYERQVLLDHGGYVNEEEGQEEPKSHYQEQKDIKDSFLKAVEAADSDDNEENDDEEEGGLGGGLLERRVKTKEEEEEEEAKYRNFMLENIAVREIINYYYYYLIDSDSHIFILYIVNRLMKQVQKHSRIGMKIIKKIQMLLKVMHS